MHCESSGQHGARTRTWRTTERKGRLSGFLPCYEGQSTWCTYVPVDRWVLDIDFFIELLIYLLSCLLTHTLTHSLKPSYPRFLPFSHYFHYFQCIPCPQSSQFLLFFPSISHPVGIRMGSKARVGKSRACQSVVQSTFVCAVLVCVVCFLPAFTWITSFYKSFDVLLISSWR